MNEGLLDSKKDSAHPTADACEDWSIKAKSRVRYAKSLNDGAERGDWRFENAFPLRNDDADGPIDGLIVEHLHDAAQSEEGRSISRLQLLSDHQNCAEQKARKIAEGVGLSSDAAEALALAARLHDEGKKAPRWQRAFRAPCDKDETGAFKSFAKTPGPVDLKNLDHYRHEFGSLPCAESHARFRDLPEDWRSLVLHLIAAHHGQARPVIGIGGCEDAPPSALQMRARDVALRFATLQKRWGPWGLAWWEALLRAADQQASRDNDKSEQPSLPQTEKS